MVLDSSSVVELVIQRGHKEAHCPSLAAARPVSTPAPATLRITDGHQGLADALAAKMSVLQLTEEKARASLDAVTGI